MNCLTDCHVTTRFLTDLTPLGFDGRTALELSLGYLPPKIKREILIRLPLALIDERLDRACDRYKVAVDMEYDYVVGRGARSGAPRLRRRPAKPASCHSDL